MVIKINYTSSDVYVSTSVSPVYVVVNYSGTSGGGGNFVPYTGATGDVDLGEYELKAGQVEFDQTPTGTAGVGVMRWNDSDGTVDLGLKGGNVTLQIGQEQILRVVNKTGANLLESQYRAVRIRLASEGGTQGQRLAVVLAQGNNDANSADTIGIVTENISENQEGFICTSGLVRGINTTGSLQGETWADGDIIYLSPTTPGAITKVKPTAPSHSVILGYVVYAHANNGKIFVKCDNGYELGELHDVYVPTPSNNDGIFWNSTNLRYENKTVAGALGFTPVSGTGATGQVSYWNETGSQAGSNNLFWDASNNRLGIGTATPTDKLHVAGTAKFTDNVSIVKTSNPYLVINNTGTGGKSFTFVSASDGTFQLQNTGVSIPLTISYTGESTFSSSVTANQLIINNVNTPGAKFYRNVDVGTFGEAGQGIEFGAKSGSTYVSSAAIYGGLEVSGTSGNLSFRTLNSGTLTERARFTAAGRFLIGTTTENNSALLNLTSTSQGFLAPRMTTTEKNAIASPATGLQVYDTTLGSLNVYNGTAWVALGAGGGGTTIYTGDGTLTGNRIVTMGAFTLTFDKDLLVNGLTVGTGGGNIAGNTVLGYQALNTNLTTGLHTAIGYQALFSKTTLSAETAIGYQSMYSNVNAAYNVSIGYRSMYSTTSGSYNTAIGWESLFTQTTNGGNTAIGYNSLRNNIGSDNTAIGKNAMSNSTATSTNVAIGDSALLNIAAGSQNTAVGVISMSVLTSGSTNSAFGRASLLSFTSGSFNTAIGASSIPLTTNASDNTAIGYGAGYNASGVNANTTGSNNIFIGSLSGGESATESNRTWIGNLSTTSTWVGGNLLVGIRTNSTYKLDVNGTARVSGDIQINGVFRETVTTSRQTASYTLALTDNGKLVEMNVATANNLTVPLNSSIAFPVGTKIDIAQYGAGQTTVVATSGVTIRSAGGALKLALQYSGASLVKIGTDEWYLFGDITV